jgi:hypothetical protein
LKRKVLNVAFRNTVSSTVAELNQRLNDCAINLQVIQTVDYASQKQEDADDLVSELSNISEQILEELSAVKKDSVQLKALIEELRAQCDRKDGEIAQKLSQLMEVAVSGKALTIREIGSLEEKLQSEVQQISKEMKAQLDKQLQVMQEVQGELETIMAKKKEREEVGKKENNNNSTSENTLLSAEEQAREDFQKVLFFLTTGKALQ